MKIEQPIRSYVRREHRMTPGQARALKEYYCKYVLSVQDGFIDSTPETVLEIGFGMGQSLLSLAKQYPQKLFIGVEVYRPGAGALIGAAVRQEVQNLKIFLDDIILVLNQCIIDNSLSEILIYFPDPWPKNRHQKRRLINPGFINLAVTKLKNNGFLHLATDCQNYAEQMLFVLQANTQLINCADVGGYLSHRRERQITKFEQRSIDVGNPVFDLLFMKTLK